MEEKTNTYLSFYLGNELFGIHIGNVLEVLKNETITHVPKTREFIRGIINFRGEIVSVIDFYEKLNLPKNDEYSEKVIIILEFIDGENPVKVAVLADKVKKVFEEAEAKIKSVPEFSSYYNPEFLNGAVKDDEGFILLLNVEKIFTEKEVQLIKNTDNNNK
jgi:purine-binding chemotaxis protein CheW